MVSTKYVYENLNLPELKSHPDIDAMVEARKLANKIESEREKAIAYSETVLPYFSPIRANADELELIVDDELWPLPKYREMLFIR